MRCSKCNKNNIIRAQYCKFCGKKISEKERNDAYKKTIFYKIDCIKDWYEKLTLSNITSHPLFRVAVLLIILFIGLYQVFINGNELNILESNLYKTIYDSKDKEYYLIVDNNTESVAVNFYVPNRTDKIVIYRYDKNDKLLDSVSYNEYDDILINVNYDDYYIIRGVYSNNKDTKIKVIVYNEGRVLLDDIGN